MKTASLAHSHNYALRHRLYVSTHPGQARPAPPHCDLGLLAAATVGSFRKLDPISLVRKPVILVVEVGAALTTALVIRDAVAGILGVSFELQIAVWLWLTVLSANFAEAIVEARGKAKADTLRKSKSDVIAKLVCAEERIERIASSNLRSGDVVLCEAGDTIPGDGGVIEGIATVDESVITGESAPVIREPGGDRSAVIGGTRLLSDCIRIQISANPGESFLDRMIALVEGAGRRKAPHRIALVILIAGLSSILLLLLAILLPHSTSTLTALGADSPPTFPVLLALLVCLIPTTIGGLLSAVRIDGMDRLVRRNILAKSTRATEAVGYVNTLLLDKTGTITLGDRQAVAFLPVPGVSEHELADAAQLASLADETPEGRSIVVLAKQKHNLRGRDMRGPHTHFIPFSTCTRISGVDTDGMQLRKGATDAVVQFVREHRGKVPAALFELSEQVARSGGTPLAVADGSRVLGIIHLKDAVKGGIGDRISELRAMGIRTVMVTGDNPLTAAAIAEKAGVDDFIAQATPREKLEYIRKEQARGRMVAMAGDDTNDAPALAQADVGLAMNTGAAAAKVAGNMLDLDSNPTKLIEIAMSGRQSLITRSALTIFSIANDVAKCFAIIPVLFAGTYPTLAAFNIMGMHSPRSAVLAVVMFNALIIITLVPLALRGVAYRPQRAARQLRRNLLIYGPGGLLAPFLGIWTIHWIITLLHLA
ncbi:MAG: K+-transporting ATPase, subunit [Acidobacteria bacterium]|nr:K+-transporting ATPase, subunit [Acidobacteriota bacterium]